MLHPYSYKLEDGLYYTFTTKDGIVYHAYFLSVSAFYPELPNTFTFNIEPVDSYAQAKHSLDIRIQHTVVAILQEFFKNNENCMLMVCDSVDGKERKRRDMFNRWFENNKDERIEKFDASLESHDDACSYNMYVSLYICKNNPNKKQIVSAFNKLVLTDMYELSL